MISGASEQGAISEINVTPLVDITLVLLIIFMVTAKIVSTQALALDLPRASQTEEVQVVFSVILQADGVILVNGEPVANDDEVLDRARQAMGRDKEVRAVISADGTVEHRRIMRTLDLLKKGGVTKIAFGALPEEEVKP